MKDEEFGFRQRCTVLCKRLLHKTLYILYFQTLLLHKNKKKLCRKKNVCQERKQQIT